jgi:hypothetical protein
LKDGKIVSEINTVGHWGIVAGKRLEGKKNIISNYDPGYARSDID